MQISEQSNTNKCEHNYLSPIVHHQDSQSCVSGQERRAAHKCVTGVTNTSFTRARLLGLARFDSARFAKSKRVNTSSAKPFRTKPALLNKPGYSLTHGLARFA